MIPKNHSCVGTFQYFEIDYRIHETACYCIHSAMIIMIVEKVKNENNCNVKCKSPNSPLFYCLRLCLSNNITTGTNNGGK